MGWWTSTATWWPPEQTRQPFQCSRRVSRWLQGQSNLESQWSTGNICRWLCVQSRSLQVVWWSAGPAGYFQVWCHYVSTCVTSARPGHPPAAGWWCEYSPQWSPVWRTCSQTTLNCKYSPWSHAARWTLCSPTLGSPRVQKGWMRGCRLNCRGQWRHSNWFHFWRCSFHSCSFCLRVSFKVWLQFQES